MRIPPKNDFRRKNDGYLATEAYGNNRKEWSLNGMGEALWPTLWSIITSDEGIIAVNDTFVIKENFDFERCFSKGKIESVQYGAGSTSDPAIDANFELEMKEKDLNLLLIGDKRGLAAKNSENLEGILFNDYFSPFCEFFTGSKSLDEIGSNVSESAEDKIFSAYKDIILEDDEPVEPPDEPEEPEEPSEEPEEPAEPEESVFSSGLKVKKATLILTFHAHDYHYVRDEKIEDDGSKKLNPNYVTEVVVDLNMSFKECSANPLSIGKYTLYPKRTSTMNPQATFKERMQEVFKPHGKPLDAAVLKYFASRMFGGTKVAGFFSKTVQQEKVKFEVKEKCDKRYNESNFSSPRGLVLKTDSKKIEKIQANLQQRIDNLIEKVGASHLKITTKLKNQNEAKFEFEITFYGHQLYIGTLSLTDSK